LQRFTFWRAETKKGTACHGGACSGGHGGRNSGPFSKEIDRSDRSGADCGALAETRTNSPDLEHALNDPELVAIVAAWPSLSASVRAGINALIRDSGGQYE